MNESENYEELLKKYNELQERLTKCLEEKKQLEKDNLVLQYERSKALKELHQLQENIVASEIKKRFPEIVKENKKVSD